MNPGTVPDRLTAQRGVLLEHVGVRQILPLLLRERQLPRSKPFREPRSARGSSVKRAMNLSPSKPLLSASALTCSGSAGMPRTSMMLPSTRPKAVARVSIVTMLPLFS